MLVQQKQTYPALLLVFDGVEFFVAPFASFRSNLLTFRVGCLDVGVTIDTVTVGVLAKILYSSCYYLDTSIGVKFGRQNVCAVVKDYSIFSHSYKLVVF